jgi:hypothetical protein
MEKLSINSIISNIEQGKTFHAVAEDYSFTIKIDDYVHYVCGAVHDGHQFRQELWENCLHTAYDRWYEEDPETKNMVSTHPIVIAGCDSRFEYDLNRGPESAIYEDAWGKKLWKNPLEQDIYDRSIQKHYNFYKVVHALISKIESLYKTCIVYDMHSYNWKRWDREVPTWNLGTSNIDNSRFGNEVNRWKNYLSTLKLPNNIKSDCEINNTFQGNGYFLKYITNNFKNTLVLATEIAKVYCDEYTQIIYPEVVVAVEKQLRDGLPKHADQFLKNHK